MGVSCAVCLGRRDFLSETAKGMKNEEFAITERQTKVARFFALRWPYREIADAVGCSIATVSRDVQAVLAEYREQRLSKIDEYLIDQLMAIDKVERKCWRQFERSCKKSVEYVKESGAIPTGSTSKRRKKIVEQCGDSAYMLAILKCVEQRCKVLDRLLPKLEASQRKKPVKLVVRNREEVMQFKDFMEKHGGSVFN